MRVGKEGAGGRGEESEPGNRHCANCLTATHVGVETVVELVLSLLLLVASGGLLVLLSGVETLVGVDLGVLDDLGLRVLGVWCHF